MADPRPVSWRGLSGYGDEYGGLPLPAPDLEPLSRSEGDLNRNSYRASGYPRLAVRAVANDDGTPVAERTEALLVEIRDLLIAVRDKIK